MVNFSDDQLDLIFHALADRTRRRMLLDLSRGICSVGELAEPHAMSLPAISKHLKILERAGLIVKTKEGRIFRCSIDPEPLDRANDLIGYYRGFWQERFDALAAFLEASKQSDHHLTPFEKKEQKHHAPSTNKEND